MSSFFSMAKEQVLVYDKEVVEFQYIYIYIFIALDFELTLSKIKYIL